MTDEYILAIDQGTTGNTAMLVDRAMQVIASVNREFPNYYPEPGRVEHDANEIWASVREVVKAVLAESGAGGDDIVAIGITNQRETCLFWDRESGTPLGRAIVWQDRRTASRCEELAAAGYEELIRERTGLVIDPYFCATKAEWMLREAAGARQRAAGGDLLFGTMDSWLVWSFCGEHVSDASNASRTMLFDIHRGDWCDELLNLFDIPRACLPAVVDSSGVAGRTEGLDFLPDGIPVAGLIGDQQGALFGQAAFDAGMAKSTYGTGAFVLLNTGTEPVSSSAGMLSTIAWRIGGETRYALEGSAFIAGAAVQWLRDGLGVIDAASDIEALAASVPDADGVVFVPALTGLGAPHWRPDATGLIHGITRGTTRAHIARAALDGIAMQITDILEAMRGDLDAPLRELRVDGGAARNDLLIQLQADLTGLTCVRPRYLETTGLGSALLAGLATGFWASTAEIAGGWQAEQRFEPDDDRPGLAGIKRRWQDAVRIA